MANGFESSINIGIKLQPQNEVKQQLESMLSQISRDAKIDLNINTKNLEDSLKSLDGILSDLQKTITNKIDFSKINTKGLTKNINKALNSTDIKNLQTSAIEKFISEAGISMGKTFQKSFIKSVKENWNNGDLDKILEEALKANEKALDNSEKAMAKAFKSDELERYIGFLKEIKVLIGDIKNPKVNTQTISLRNIPLSKDELAQFKKDTRGKLAVDDLKGIGVDTIMEEWTEKAQKFGFTLEGVIQDKLLRIGQIISEYTSLKNSKPMGGSLISDEDEKEQIKRVNYAYAGLIEELEKINNLKSNTNNNNQIDQEIEKTQKLNSELQETNKIKEQSANIGTGAKGFDELQQRANEIRNTVDSLAKFSFDTTKSGDLTKAVITYKDALGNAVTETMKWEEVTDSVTNEVSQKFHTVNIKVTENVEKINQLQTKVATAKESMQTQLSDAFSKGLIDTSRFDKLQKKLDLINTDTAESEIKQLQNAIKEELNLVNEMANGREKSISNRQVLDRQAELAQSQAINRALDEEYKSLEKIEKVKANLQSKLTVSYNNGFINTSVLDSLQNRLNSINTNTAENEINSLKSAIINLSTADAQIVRLEKSISDAESKLSGMKSKFSDIITSEATNELKSYESQLEKLKFTLSELKNNNITISSKGVTSELNSMSSASNQLSSALRESSGETNSFGSSMKNILGDMGIFVTSAMAVSKGIEEIKSGVEEVMQVEDSLTNLKRIYSMTDVEANNLTKTISNQAKSLGTDTSTLMDTVTTFKKLGYSIQEAQSLASETQKFDYSADINNIQQSALSLVSTLKGFNLDASHVKEIGDAIDQVGNNFAVDAKDINEILRESSATLGTFGNSVNEAIALGTTAQEVMQDAGTVGNALKSLSARLTTNKSAINALKELKIGLKDVNGQTKSTFDLMQELGKAWEQLDATADKNNLANNLFGKNHLSTGLAIINNYKQLDNVLQNIAQGEGVVDQEFALRMDTTSAKVQQLKQTINQMWEGAISTDFTKGVIDGLTKMLELFGNLPTVIGIATSALLLFKGKAISDLIQGLASTVTGIIAYETALTGSTVATTSLGTATTLLSYAFNKLEIAFMNNPIGMIAVLATGAIAGILALKNAFGETTESILKNIDNVKKEAQEVSNLENDLNKINNSKDAFNNGKLDDNKRKEFVDLNNQLAEKYPELIESYDSENKMFVIQTEKLQEIIDKKTKIQAMDNISSLNKADEELEKDKQRLDYLQKIIETKKETYIDTRGNEHTVDVKDGNLQKYISEFNELQETVGKLQGAEAQSIQIINDYSTAHKKLGESTQEINDGLLALGYSQDMIDNAFKKSSSSAENAKNKNIEYTNSVDLMRQAVIALNNGTVDDNLLNALNTEFPNLGINLDNANEKIGQFKQQLADMGVTAESSAENTASSIAEAEQEYSKCGQEIAKMEGYIQKINKAQAVTPTLQAQILKNFPQIGDAVYDASSAVEFLQKQIADTAEVQAEALEIMKGDDEAYYQEKIANNEEYHQMYNNLLNAFVTDGQDAYNVDFSNYHTLNELKNGTMTDLGSAVAQWLQNFVGVSWDGYEKDFANFKSFAEAKAGILAKLQEQIAKVQSQIADISVQKAVDNLRMTSLRNQYLANPNPDLPSDFDGHKLLKPDDWQATIDKETQELEAKSAELKKLSQAYDKVSTSFDEFSAKHNTFNPAPISGGSIGGGGSGSGRKGGGGSGSGRKGSGGSGKSQAEREAEQAQRDADRYAERINELKSDIKTDRYFDLNNALKDVENEITDLETSQKSLMDGDYQAYLSKEIDLYKKKQDALSSLNDEQKKESEELKSYLSQYGFYFDETGKLLNSQQKLLEYQNQTNAMTGNSEKELKNKQEWVDWVKKLQEYTEKYCDLVNDKIPDVTNKWKELGNSIKETKEKALKDVRDNLVDAIKQNLQEYKDNDDVTKVINSKLISDHNKKLMTRYDSSIKRLKEEIEDLKSGKESDINRLENRINKLKDQLKDLDNSFENKRTKLKKLQTELAKWQKDDSTYSKKKIVDLQTQISDLQKDIKKDEINSEIEKLNTEKDKTEESSKTRLDKLEDDLETQQDKMKKTWDAILKDKEIYAQADKLLTENNQKKIISLMTKYSDKYKEVGTLLGVNFKDALVSQVEEACSNLKSLIEDTANELNLRKTQERKENRVEPDYGDIVTLDKSSTIYKDSTGTANSGTVESHGYDDTTQFKRGAYSNGFYGIIDAKSGVAVGWIPTGDVYKYIEKEDKRKKKQAVQFASGGRTPSNIDDGAMAVLHSNEAILNANDTAKLDAIFENVKISQKLLDRLNGFLEFNAKMQQTTMPNLNYNRLLSNGSNTTTNTSNVTMKNEINITNNTKSDSYFNARSLEKMFKNQIGRFGGR